MALAVAALYGDRAVSVPEHGAPAQVFDRAPMDAFSEERWKHRRRGFRDRARAGLGQQQRSPNQQQ